MFRALELLQQRSGCSIRCPRGIGETHSDGGRIGRRIERCGRRACGWRIGRGNSIGRRPDWPSWPPSWAAMCRSFCHRQQPFVAGGANESSDYTVCDGCILSSLSHRWRLSTGDVYRAHDALSRNEDCSTELTQRVDGNTSHRDIGAICAVGCTTVCRRPRRRSRRGSSQVSAIFDRLDFVAHQLSGSGSAYFGVCRHAQHARRLAAFLRTRQLGLVYATQQLPVIGRA